MIGDKSRTSEGSSQTKKENCVNQNMAQEHPMPEICYWPRWKLSYQATNSSSRKQFHIGLPKGVHGCQWSHRQQRSGLHAKNNNPGQAGLREQLKNLAMTCNNSTTALIDAENFHTSVKIWRCVQVEIQNSKLRKQSSGRCLSNHWQHMTRQVKKRSINNREWPNGVDWIWKVLCMMPLDTELVWLTNGKLKLTVHILLKDVNAFDMKLWKPEAIDSKWQANAVTQLNWRLQIWALWWLTVCFCTS